MRRIRSIVLALSLAALLGPRTSVAQLKKPAVFLPGLSHQVSLDTVGAVRATTVPKGVLYSRLRALFKDLKISTTVDDSVAGIIGSSRSVQFHSLGGTQLASYLNCGGDVAGPLANSGRVTVALVGMLINTGGDSTLVRTALVAGAQSVEGASRDPALCSSTGQLEERIFKRITSP